VIQVNSFLYGITLTEDGKLPIYINIPKEMRGNEIDGIEIRLTEIDVYRMHRLFQMVKERMVTSIK